MALRNRELHARNDDDVVVFMASLGRQILSPALQVPVSVAATRVPPAEHYALLSIKQSSHSATDNTSGSAVKETTVKHRHKLFLLKA